MLSYLERYKNGEYEAVWQELRDLNEAILEDDIYEDAVAVARETMQRVRHNVELLHTRLIDLKYEFEWPASAFKPANPEETSKNLPYMEKVFGKLPLSVRMWYEIVGVVYFLGNHPYLAEDIASDPFCCRIDEIDKDYFDMYWSNGEQLKAMDFSPDSAAKAGFSGASDSIVVSKNRMDGIVIISGKVRNIDDKLILDVKESYFVEYLRRVFLWGGFPGFGDYLNQKGLPTKFPLIELSYLCDGLLEF